MRVLLAAALLAFGLGSPADRPASPVLVELFTSEGCSSCPPADALLSRLQVDGRVVALSFHVDYWDGLGWKDPFGAPDFTRRQRNHAARGARGGLYTPELVVDGGKGFVGSDENEARRAIGVAAQTPKPLLRLQQSGGRLKVQGEPPNEAAVAWLALAEDGLETRVLRGENGGRTLRHDGVVRELRRLGDLAAGTAFQQDIDYVLHPGWARHRMKAVVFLESAATGRILAVAAARL